MTVIGSRFDLKPFKRGLSSNCVAALKELSDSSADNWWKEVLESKSLLLAVRSGYLNAYVKGQSVFKIAFGKRGAEAGQPRLAIHYKYLIKPELEEKDPYVSFDGTKFALDPSTIVSTAYESKLTLPQLIKTASRFSGAEKAGVHKIAQNEPNVVDLEVAFTHIGDENEISAPRMDLAVLVPGQKGNASLVFCEAKCADNEELWKLEGEKKQQSGKAASALSPRRIKVVAQVSKYEEFIRDNTSRLAEAYVDVCKTLVHLNDQRSTRRLDDLITAVAEGKLKLSIHPHVYLLVYDFDGDQKEGAVKGRLAKLRSEGLRIIAKGNPAEFKLANDIMRAQASKQRL
jgi:hypothetical protein